MSTNTTPTAIVTLNSEVLEFVGDFTYLGSLISKVTTAQKDTKARLGRAHCAFAKLQNIWKSKQYTIKWKSNMELHKKAGCNSAVLEIKLQCQTEMARTRAKNT